MLSLARAGCLISPFHENQRLPAPCSTIGNHRPTAVSRHPQTEDTHTVGSYVYSWKRVLTQYCLLSPVLPALVPVVGAGRGPGRATSRRRFASVPRQTSAAFPAPCSAAAAARVAAAPARLQSIRCITQQRNPPESENRWRRAPRVSMGAAITGMLRYKNGRRRKRQKRCSAERAKRHTVRRRSLSSFWTGLVVIWSAEV